MARFYFLINEERYDEAAALWTQEMRNRYPPYEYINGRFSQTERIVVNRNELVAIDGDRGTAVVAVNLTEYRTSGEVRRITGSWDLVRVNGAWLLADPDLAIQ